MSKHLAQLGLAAVLAATLSFAAACGGHGHAASSASAEASALAHNPKIVAAENHWKPVVRACDAGQHWLTHPLRSAENLVNCSTRGLTARQKKAAEQCASTGIFRNGLHQSAIPRDETTLALCLARVAPPKAKR